MVMSTNNKITILNAKLQSVLFASLYYIKNIDKK